MSRKSLHIFVPVCLVLAFVLIFGYSLTLAQNGQRALESATVGTAFTYQGRLNDGGTPANGSYDFNFSLYDTLSAGNQIGTLVEQTIVVSEGLFTTQLDFGADVFNGEPRYLAIEVQFGGGGYFQLTPRQPLTAVPYASYADKVQPIENVVNVAKSGGDYTSIQTALDNITATANDRYLIRVAPGIYDGTVSLESYVDIEGSGEGVTILSGPGGNSLTISDATLQASGVINAEVRQLSVESDGSGNFYGVAIVTENVPTNTLKLTHITASGSGGSQNNYGMINFSSAPTMNDMTITGSGGLIGIGVNNNGASPMMNNVIVTGSGGSFDSYGIYNDNASSPTIRESALTGATASITNLSSTAKFANTMLDGPITAGATCFNTYDASFAAVACP